MPVVRTYRLPIYQAAVMEDPMPGSQFIYFQNYVYNKTTLTPQYDSEVVFSTTGGITYSNLPDPSNAANGNLSNFGAGAQAFTSTGTFLGGATSYGVFTGILILNNDTTHVRHTRFNSINSHRNNIDPTPFLSMDPARQPRPASYWTDGTNYASYWVMTHKGGSGENATVAWPESGNNDTTFVAKINHNSLDFVSLRSRGSSTNAAGAVSSNGHELFSYPMYRNPSTGNLIWFGLLGQYQSAGQQGYPSAGVGWHRGGAFSLSATGASTTSPTSGLTTNSTGQFVGVSAIDGLVISLTISTQDDITQTFRKYNDSSNTFTTLNSFSASPGASGSSVGGNRGSLIAGFKSKFASSWFTDPLTANSRGFYVPYMDTGGNYVPFYFQWNTQTDSFTRNSNCTINWGGGNNQTTFWQVDSTSAGTNSEFGMQTVWWNEIFTVGSNRYLLFMQLNGCGGINDGVLRARTFITFSVNAADPRSLTYHSRIEVPVTPKNIVWLNDAHTTIGIFGTNNFYIYTFSEANGWTQSANLPFQFNAVGRDNLGRIWAAEGGPLNAGRVHLITLTVPVTIVVTPAATTFTYTGSAINSNVSVRALDANGNRISTNVKLVIDGGSMLFGGNNFTTTVTTSASSDVVVPVTISGGGVSNIIASVPV